MSKKFKVNKEKCIGCGTCVQVSDGATQIADDGKAEIIDQEKLEQHGGVEACPFGAIEIEE